MRYFCLTDRPVEWPLPRFMSAVSTVPAGDGVLDLGTRYPELAGRTGELGEYATLFALRRFLQQTPDSAGQDVVGIAHRDRFAVTRPAGIPADGVGIVAPEKLGALPETLFLPKPGTVLFPMPVDLGSSVMTCSAADHTTRDLLHFMALAIELGVIHEKVVAQLLGQQVTVPICSVGVYPAQWLVQVLENIEKVADAFRATVADPADDGAAVRAGCRQLHAVYLSVLVQQVPAEHLQACRLAVVGVAGAAVDAA